jgi:tRNA-splicing ligase RtcB (3'-phosphate/5'-hydroxy nucleic acid ligase)
VTFTLYGQHDDNTIAQMEGVMASGAAYGVLCADGHYGYGHPIGGVAAYREHISISGVGFDIACGNMAIKLDTRYEDIKADAGTILADIGRAISFGIGQKNDERVEHWIFDAYDLWSKANALDLRQKAREQLGTVGSGNHYVDLFSDDQGQVWIGVHFGSRGLGHTLTTRALKAAGATDRMDAPPALVARNSEDGERYYWGIALAGQYAYAGRGWVVERVRQIIGGQEVDRVHNHHNFMWEEEHHGERLMVVRKGATPAFPGERGFVGGSMGDDAVIIKGVDSELSKTSLYSTVHGAGRTMSRTAARGKYVKDENGKKQRQPGLVRHDEWQAWMRDKGVLLLGGDLDEAPQAYRRLPDVLAAHEGTIEVEHTLRPFAVAMAGAKDFDPYKD